MTNTGGKGYARKVMQFLVNVRRQEAIFIHSTLVLISFYKAFGWYPIPEHQLPKSIRERFISCFGEMEGCNVAPMLREGKT